MRLAGEGRLNAPARPVSLSRRKSAS